MRHVLAILSLVPLLSAQDEPRPARAILRDYGRVAMPAFSSGNDAESLRRFEDAIREGSLRKAALALELFEGHPEHPRLPDLMSTRWATFNNVTGEHAKVIVETSLLLEGGDVRDDLARVAVAARTRAITWSPLSTNLDRLDALNELFAVDSESEATGIALMDVAQHHLSDPESMRRLFAIGARRWPESAWVGRSAGRWLELLEKLDTSFVDQLPEELRGRFEAAAGEPAEFTVVQVWSGWVMTRDSRREVAAVRELRETFGEGARVVGIISGDLDSRLPAAREAGVDWPQLGFESAPGAGDALLRVPRTPCYFVLDRRFDIVGIHGGAAAAALRIRTLREQPVR